MKNEDSECCWCGGEIEKPFPNKRGEVFCSKNHRTASNAALRKFLMRGELAALEKADE